MAISSVGYAGTVGDAQWAEMVPRAGGVFYSVEDYASFRVTAAAGTRTIQVAAGKAAGAGIYDQSNAVETRALGSVPSGVRYDLVVLRRTWATKLSEIVVIPGGSAAALPGRNTTPGTVDDQPLALVRVAAGSTTIQEVIDLRVAIHNGGAVAFNELVRSFLTQLGTEILINDVIWTRTVNSAGVPLWKGDDRTDTGWVAVSKGSKWLAVTGYPLQIRRVGKLVEIRGAVKHATGAAITGLCAIPVGFRPKGSVPLGATHTSSAYIGDMFVSSTGVVAFSTDYRTGSFAAGSVVMIHGFWFLD